ncbi:MAG: bifunctional hydroxymethylpyrimidine kinase/phosphomethylpyrimidine kinase [Eggerthellaceae bacterium]|jgi:hydroxymethylpyrimidine/phosphomethylpyrimidine kinase|nr:bifunctional hydroxymethylpyrimidine kinase/phosphomethylpyrimidine kinase [Eggerthellaceae bacterium]MDR2716090.1 bifunctional hydroxymethylpyrimidine kinase/phosphomethylpyrimidine kinase [Coriobacteriaceae bacterium]
MLAVLSIAGSDSSGGAGIQADIKTIAAHRLFAETALTALTAQNTTGVFALEELSPRFVAQQIDAVFEDIRPAAVKIGVVSSAAIVEAIAERLAHWKAENIVLDPVMIATSQAKLINDDAVGALRERLIPLANLITPNLFEAEVLSGLSLTTDEEQARAAVLLAQSTRCAVLVKGGHNTERADDVLATKEGEVVWARGARIETGNTHGTGCTLSSAIACNLALGLDMAAAVRKAKDYVTGALENGINLGQGSGPINHMWEYRD